MWSELTWAFMPGAYSRCDSAYSAPTVCVKVHAAQPIEVTACVDSMVDDDLKADTLLADDGSDAKIPAESISIKQLDGNVLVVLELSKPVPPKRYKGAIRTKSDNCHWGSITVVAQS